VLRRSLRRGPRTAAAEWLHLAQPTVSAALADLEASPGVQVLLRHYARGVSPTPAGRELLPDARAAVRAAAALAAETRDELVDAIDVGVLLTLAPVVAPGLARSFETRVPQVELRMAELSQDELIRRLADGRLAVAVTYDSAFAR
jgi:DNA-binding transcriptional LysR family regulator